MDTVDRIRRFLAIPSGFAVLAADKRIDHLNVVSIVLDRYGLLDQFERDVLRARMGPDAKQEYANLAR